MLADILDLAAILNAFAFTFFYRAPFDSAYEKYPIFKFSHFKCKNYHGLVILHDIGYFVLVIWPFKVTIPSMWRPSWILGSSIICVDFLNPNLNLKVTWQEHIMCYRATGRGLHG